MISMQKLRTHLRQLCRQHRIKYRTHNDEPFTHDRAELDTKTIYVAPIRNRAAYANALHEIGHLVTRTASKPSLYQEGAAWQWARDNALCWTPAMERSMLRGLKTYLDIALSEHEQLVPGLRAPPRDHPFWTLQAEVPEVRALLSKKHPDWLHPEAATIPWSRVLSHSERPRCENCTFWNPFVQFDQKTPREKRSLGTCHHREIPLGSENTPGGAFCGAFWIRRDD